MNLKDYKHHWCDKNRDSDEVIFDERNGTWHTGEAYHMLKINYCPFCGMKL